MDIHETHEFFAAMPKVELHVHLEGALPAQALWLMAEMNGVTLPARTAEELDDFLAYRDFDHFIEAYYAATSTMRTADDWAFMVREFVASQAAQGIVHTEAFISASHHLDRHVWTDWIAAIAESKAAAEAAHGVRVEFIPDISRETPESRFKVLEFILQARESGAAIGLGIGGPEVGFPPEDYVDVFAEARRQGLKVVAHAGETMGAESVRGAVEGLGALRVGHGIRSLEDPSLIAVLAQNRTPIEVCPTSNYCTGVVAKGEAHPIHQMVKAGLHVTVNSDDPALFNTTLAQEFSLLHQQGMSLETLWQLNLNAIEAAFLTDEEKNEIRAKAKTFALDGFRELSLA